MTFDSHVAPYCIGEVFEKIYSEVLGGHAAFSVGRSKEVPPVMFWRRGGMPCATSRIHHVLH